jgi:dCMP deaminase
MTEYNRPSWDEYFFDVMEAVAKRATCDRGRSGCVIARDNVLLSTGYVGAPKGSPECDAVGHLMKSVIDEDGTTGRHCVRTAHAEANAICQAAKNGVSINGATLYCRMTPCRNCAMMIANSGIKRVIAQTDYHSSSATEGKEILKAAGVEFIMLAEVAPSYPDQ